MITLQINHSKHAKNVSGGRLGKNSQNQKKQSQIKQQLDLTSKQNIQLQSEYPKKSITLNNKENNNNKEISNIQSTGSTKFYQKKSSIQVDKQLETISNIHNAQNKVKKTIEQLLYDYKGTADDILLNHGYNLQKQYIIKQHLQKLQQEKSKRQQKINKIKERQFRTLQTKQQKKHQKANLQKQKSHQKIKKRVQYKIKSLQNQRLKRQIKQEEFATYLKEFKKKKPKYKLWQEQYNKKQNEQYLNKELSIKKKLKESNAPINIGQLNDFEQKYKQKLYQLNLENQEKRQLNKKLLQQHQKKLKNIYRSQFYDNAIKQIQEHKKKKQQAYKKLERTKQYSTIVKQQYMPKKRKLSDQSVDSDDSDIFEIRKKPSTVVDNSNKKIKYRFLNGVNQGMVFQEQKNALNYSQMVKRGNDYLNYIVSLPKVKKQKSEQNQEQSRLTQIKKISKPPVPRAPRKEASIYQQYKRPNSIDLGKIDNCQKMSGFIDKLKFQDKSLELQNKIINHQRYDDILSLQRKKVKVTNKMVDSIEQKLKILSKLS